MMKTIFQWKVLSAIGTEDKERAITPIALYNKLDKNIWVGHLFAIGWWAWGVGFIIWRSK